MIRRKVAILALAMVSETVTYEVFGRTPALVLAVSFTLCVAFLFRKNALSGSTPYEKKPVIVSFSPLGASVLIITVWFCFFHLLLIDSAQRQLPGLEGSGQRLEGKVIEADIRKDDASDPGEYVFVVEVDMTGDGASSCRGILIPKKERILVNCGREGEDIVPGDMVDLLGKISIPGSRRNPNTFDYSRYLRTKGIYTVMYADDIRLSGQPSESFTARLFRLKKGFLDDIGRTDGDETAALMGAIMFGDKGCLEDDVMETFQKNGTAHVLAVSGLHIGMIYAFLLWIWRFMSRVMPGIFGRRGTGFFVFIGMTLFAYMIMAGFAPSVVRAVAMIMLHIFSSMTGRYYDLKAAAFTVGAGALIYQPLILFQSGFQMSFLAVMSLALIMPYMRRMVPGSILATVTIQVGLLPYMMYQFNWFSPLSFLINIPVIFLAGILVPLGVASLVIYGILGSFFGEEALAFGLGSLCRIMVRLNELCCIDGITAIRVCSPPVWLVFLFYFGIVAFASEGGRLAIKRKGRKYVLCASLVIVGIASLMGLRIDDGFKGMDMVFVDVGQGDCMHIRSGKGNYLIDGGGSDSYNIGKKTLRPYLLKNGTRTIDAAFVSHLHTDHYRGICELAREGMVERLFIYESNRLKLDEVMRDTGMKADRISFLTAGQSVSLSDDPDRDRIDILWPEKKTDEEYRQMMENEEDENASSLIMRVSINGVSMLATGDMGEEGEGRLIALKGPAVTSDILKVGHHGSKYSSCDGFLDEVSPKLAVIQVGKGNTYGHPTPEVLGRLAERHVPVLRNDLQGAIGLKLGSGKIAGLRWMIEAPVE